MTSNNKKRSRTASAAKRTAGRRVDPASPMLDQSSRYDIIGISLCALAIAMGIALFAEGTGIAGEYFSQIVALAFGDGGYVLPVIIMVFGVTFFLRLNTLTEARVGMGLLLMFTALVSMFSVGAPLENFWTPESVAARGGYYGAAIAWVLVSMVGDTIAYVFLVALMLIGLVLSGASISSAISWIRNSYSATGGEDNEVRSKKRSQPRAKDVSPMPDPVGRVNPETYAETVRPPRPSAQEDPARHRKTTPSPHFAAPRAMEGFELPAPTLLERTSSRTASVNNDRELALTARLIEDTLATFDIPAKVLRWVPGPTVTMFELDLTRGIKVSRVTTLADDLALSLAAPTVRILAPIPGKSLVGIEVPNDRRQTVTLGDVLGADSKMHTSAGPLLLGVGKDVGGESVLADLATMPHLLIAGSTGTGKSVCINALLSSILMRATPSEVRLILIDPKRIELSLYNGIPHLYVPVVTEAKQAASALAWSVSEMERRLKLLQSAGARNIGMYNGLLHAGKLPEDAQELPYLVIVIDELADLMMVVAKEVEDSICRLAQMARAAGIHLIVATQRPSTDIITGLIKTNITNRIAFAVGSSIDSRVILDQPGAEKLVGLGDMLFSMPAWPKPKRIQGAYISEAEIAKIMEHVKSQANPDYHEEILTLKVAQSGGGVDTGGDEDPLLWEAADIVVTSGIGSTSLLQRRLKVGYARAGRIMDMLETRGIVGLPDGSRPREVLIDIQDLEAMMALDARDITGD